MSRLFTIFGPKPARKKLELRTDNKLLEVDFLDLENHFELQDVQWELKPISLSHGNISVQMLLLSTGIVGFLLDHDLHQFYKIILSAEKPNVLNDTDSQYSGLFSVLSIIETLPLNSSLHVALHNAQKVERVKEIPAVYNGYVVFELPPSKSGNAMVGMEQKNDSHPWIEYVTCSYDCFEGMVRFSRCAGHLRCITIDCPYYSRLNYHNETQWKGRLKKCCPVGLVTLDYGKVVCKHCGQLPECVLQCPAVMYYCIPKDRFNTTRCAIHLGDHNHPYEEGHCRADASAIDTKMKFHAEKNPFTTLKQLESVVTKDVIFEMLLTQSEDGAEEIGDAELAGMLDLITPLSDRKRTEKCLEDAKQAQGITSKGFEAVLELKHKCRYPFIHSVLFPGQMNKQIPAHVFKMSTKGPGSGVDLVNRMRPGGNLQDMWVHFDHVHRVLGWPTMSAHVYDPYVRELMTIATCEFMVEDRFAQAEFWKMLNDVVQKCGFAKPEFRGFMADEANANWLAIRTVYFGGPKNIKPSKERSCIFHWEQSMLRHTKKCIRPSFQEDHKLLCRKWRNAPNENAAENCKNEIRKFWKAGHAFAEEISALETWLSWWDNRALHWGAWLVSQDENGLFVPNTNLSESKHASMRASVGYKNQISLYEATGADMSLAILQSVKYNAYLKGAHSGSGPGIKDMVDRFYNKAGGSSLSKRLINLAHSSMQDMGVEPSNLQNSNVHQQSLYKKRPRISDQSVMLDEDSHRPEYVTITVEKPRHKAFIEKPKEHDLPIEKKVPKTMWAIRRTEPKSKVTCFGRLSGQNGRCGRFINGDDVRTGQGVPAPCFWGRRKYPGGVAEGNIWFCNVSNTHSWNVDEDLVIAPPGPAPGVWPIDEGTNLDASEIEMLQANGFVIAYAGSNSLSNKTNAGGIANQSAIRPKYRDGKVVKWRSKLTKDFFDNIEKGRTLHAELIREAIIICNESHTFFLSTEGSKAKGLNYSITLSDFPRCSCEGFQKRESKRLPYVPCKHMYYIFLQILGLDHLAHEFIHQAALTKVELFQALGGKRCNLTG